MYKEPDYAESRIINTIVMWGLEPAYVTEVREDMTCRIKLDLDSDNQKLVHLDEINALAPPLGFVNYSGRAHYLSRRPMREDWRQGVRPSQLRVLKGTGDALDKRVIMKCMLGSFPSTVDAIKSIEDGNAMSVAINRKICLESRRGGGVNIIHGWRGIVGRVVDGVLVLKKSKRYLSKLLEV